MSRVKNNTYLLLRVRQEQKSRVKNGRDLLLRVRQDKKYRIKNDADLLLRVTQDKMSKECRRPVANSKTRQED